MGIIENHILKLTENCLELWILDQFKTVVSKVELAVKIPCLDLFEGDVHCLSQFIPEAYCVPHIINAQYTSTGYLINTINIVTTNQFKAYLYTWLLK